MVCAFNISKVEWLLLSISGRCPILRYPDYGNYSQQKLCKQFCAYKVAHGRPSYFRPSISVYYFHLETPAVSKMASYPLVNDMIYL